MHPFGLVYVSLPGTFIITAESKCLQVSTDHVRCSTITMIVAVSLINKFPSTAVSDRCLSVIKGWGSGGSLNQGRPPGLCKPEVLQTGGGRHTDTTQRQNKNEIIKLLFQDRCLPAFQTDGENPTRGGGW
jgi:hypothetical protein